MANITMKAKDTLSAALAECFVTIDDRRYNIMQAINVELQFKKKKTEVPILGKSGKGNKASGWSGTGKATMHYNTSVFRELALRYKDTGEDVYFDMQITNEDPSSAAGKQTVIAYDCNLDALARTLSYRLNALVTNCLFVIISNESLKTADTNWFELDAKSTLAFALGFLWADTTTDGRKRRGRLDGFSCTDDIALS